MEIPLDILESMVQYPLLTECGTRNQQLVEGGCWQIPEADTVLELLESDHWVDIKVRANEDLSGFLVKKDYETVGTYWNPMDDAAQKWFEDHVEERLINRVASVGFPRRIVSIVIRDLVSSALERAFAGKYAEAPLFFSELSMVYSKGHIPCGWDGEVAAWPKGKLLFF